MSKHGDAFRKRGYQLFGDDDAPFREFWLAAKLVDWLDEELFGARPPAQQNGVWKGDSHPYEQVDQALDAYANNPAFRNTGQIVNIIPQHHGVFEFKTEDVRIFGWFIDRRCFIGCYGQLKCELRGSKLDHIRKNIVKLRGSDPYVTKDYL